MEDVAPALLAAIRAAFLRQLGEDGPAPGSYEAAGVYADRVGAALAAAFAQQLAGDALPDGRMYWNIAVRVVKPLLEEDYARCAAAAAAVQQVLNAAAGLGLAVETPGPDTERIDGILQGLCAAQQYADAAHLLEAPVLENFSRAAVDETLRRNVEAHARAGLHPRVIRRAEAGCCRWCASLAGTYNYPDVPKDVFRRHRSCRCVVEYDPATGRRQNVWTKRWTDGEESAILEKRNLLAAEETALAEARRQQRIAGAITDPESERALEHAERYYGLVRNMTTDCRRIAENTGLPLEEIERIKSFVFLETHDLGDGIRRFDASFEMAQSWQRLIDGKNIQPHDLTLLRHEIMERQLMLDGMTQDDAHILTSEKYNYRREAAAYYDSLEKHQKK